MFLYTITRILDIPLEIKWMISKLLYHERFLLTIEHFETQLFFYQHRFRLGVPTTHLDLFDIADLLLLADTYRDRAVFLTIDRTSPRYPHLTTHHRLPCQVFRQDYHVLFIPHRSYRYDRTQ